MDTKIRSPRGSTLTLVFFVSAAIAAPITMLVMYPWATRDQIARVMNLAVEAAQPAEAHAATPTMVFEPEVITLQEADDVAAAGCRVEVEETDDGLEFTFTPVCDQDPLANAPIASLTYDTERGTLPFDIVESVRSYVAEPNR
ncbi:MAG: hypothetical protein Q8R16_03040 [bacterium]|nr:hypothetical protein [bacterium]